MKISCLYEGKCVLFWLHTWENWNVTMKVKTWSYDCTKLWSQKPVNIFY